MSAFIKTSEGLIPLIQLKMIYGRSWGDVSVSDLGLKVNGSYVVIPTSSVHNQWHSSIGWHYAQLMTCTSSSVLTFGDGNTTSIVGVCTIYELVQ